MRYDFYARFWNESTGVDFKKVGRVPNVVVKGKVLKLAREPKRAKERYRSWCKELTDEYKLATKILERLLLKSIVGDVIQVKIRFRLKRPYISKDDDLFYIIDNPICKERVFKIPFIRPTAWKGVLRFVALKMFIDNLPPDKIIAFKERAKLIRLFGNEKDRIEDFINRIFNKRYKPETPRKSVSDEFSDYILKRGYVNKDGNRRGRLIFYPTIFDRFEFDVITPLDRVTRIPVRGPIMFEVVPKEAKGIFELLYIPFDILRDKERLKIEVPEDLRILKDTIPKMMLEYGFSAKKTSGYGVVEDSIDFWINGKYYTGTFDKFKEVMTNLISSFDGG